MEATIPHHVLFQGLERGRREHRRAHVMSVEDLVQENTVDEPAQAETEDDAGPLDTGRPAESMGRPPYYLSATRTWRNWQTRRT